MKNAVGYIRVSTEEQAGDDRYGIAAQRAAIERYAEEREFQIVKWYIDEASGVSDSRPEWNKILSEDDITNPPFEAVIAFKSDRIARDMKLYFYYLYVLEKRNVDMLSTQEDFGEEGAFADIFRSLMLFVAEQERKNITLRTSAGRRVKAQQGGFAGGRPPYGYKVVNKELVVDDEEAYVVRLIYRLYGEGKRRKHICLILEAMGIKTRNGKNFPEPLISSILKKRDTYLGYKSYKGVGKVKGKQPPILNEVDFV